MTDTAEPDTAQLPDWYERSNRLYEDTQLRGRTAQARVLQQQAAAINKRLEDLGMPPLQPARVVPGPRLEAALLVPADPEHELYAVHAVWDDTNQETALAVQDYCEPWHDGPRYWGLLHNLADVATARHEGPAPHTMRAAPPDLRSLALAAGNRLNADYIGADSYAVAEQLAALTAAVVHLADTVTRSLSRP